MDEQTTTETFEIDQIQEPSLATILMRTAALNAAATAGSIVGLVLIGAAAGKASDLYDARKARKAAATETTTTEA